jgi:endoplasmic reticulum Man9GlcNAc2 1,2-alpha-mannosidase
MLGGLLSAHYLSTILPSVSSRRDYIYPNKSIDLADRLLGAYSSQSGIPYASIWLDNGAGILSHADGGSSSTAEASTTQMEMKSLAHLTGNEEYWRKAENVIKVLDENNAQGGLLPIFVHPDSGKFTSREIRLGSRGDSYYEYLVKQYLQTNETIYLDMWEQVLAGIQRHIVTSTSVAKLQFVAELPQGIGSKLYPKMDHLVCFLPGSIALGITGGLTIAEAKRLPTWNKIKERQLHLAKELMKTCFGMYQVTATGLAPEIAFFNVDEANLVPGQQPSTRAGNDWLEDWKKDVIIKPLDAHNLQRPETVESLMLVYRITEDTLYCQWGWRIFQAFQNHSLMGDGEGFTSLSDVNTIPSPRRDNMESFWLAETLKYLYLLFSSPDFLPLTEVVFNTEAHILPRLRDPLFKTGWNRKQYFST